jgi:hypothetical protein
MSIETGMPEVPRFAMYSGCVLDQLSWQMQRSGLLTATARLVAQGETVARPPRRHARRAGAAALRPFQRRDHAQRRALGNVVSAEITYANNLDRIETIRSDGRIDGADPVHRRADRPDRGALRRQTLVTQAINGEPCEMEFAYVAALGRELHLHRHAVYLPRPRIEISGPQGVQATFDWQAARDTSSAGCAPPP